MTPPHPRGALYGGLDSCSTWQSQKQLNKRERREVQPPSAGKQVSPMQDPLATGMRQGSGKAELSVQQVGPLPTRMRKKMGLKPPSLHKAQQKVDRWIAPAVKTHLKSNPKLHGPFTVSVTWGRSLRKKASRIHFPRHEPAEAERNTPLTTAAWRSPRSVHFLSTCHLLSLCRDPWLHSFVDGEERKEQPPSD